MSGVFYFQLVNESEICQILRTLSESPVKTSDLAIVVMKHGVRWATLVNSFSEFLAATEILSERLADAGHFDAATAATHTCAGFPPGLQIGDDGSGFGYISPSETTVLMDGLRALPHIDDAGVIEDSDELGGEHRNDFDDKNGREFVDELSFALEESCAEAVERGWAIAIAHDW